MRIPVVIGAYGYWLQKNVRQLVSLWKGSPFLHDFS